LAADLLEQLEPEIESITLIPSDEGRFEVEVNDDLVYSKLKTERHPKPGEILELVQKKLANKA
jgi:selenoprotein W-related protein